MDDIRKGQIAFFMLKNLFREKGRNFTSDFLQKIEDEAKIFGISFEEITEFVGYIVRDLIEEITKTEKTNKYG